MKIWDRRRECACREEIDELQRQNLARTLKWAYDNVAMYRRRMDKAGFDPTAFKGPDDLRRLPFTTKQDLRDNYPFGLFAVPKDKLVRIHSSSGTTGKPTVVGYTRRDLRTWSELVARMVTAAGVTHRDTIQISFGYGLFTGGFGLHYGMERVGASVIPVSSGNTQRQLMIMQDFGTTALVSTPSYAMYMAETLAEAGIDPAGLKLRYGLFGSEPWSEEMRTELEHKWNITATDNYGLSEIMGPGVSGECLLKQGMHLAEDHFLFEIIDPKTEEPLPAGEEGELVITTLTKEALPVIRYRTRDITRIITDPCPCGRTLYRMTRVVGRTDDMLIIRGVNVFPSQVESVLLEIEGTQPHYQLVVDRQGQLDTLEVWVEVSDNLFFNEMKRMHELSETIRSRIESVLGLNVRIKLVEPRSLARSEGKAKRVLDMRKK
ncbi:MAG: phenylacetate--CoA ligase [bacterium]|jgi:phenylacetate-CoA ligase|nr:phenylacetate--CoA ligase [bacterium]MDD3806173.1 phenylacetate--CoA ligase [bacterium]MDD4558116.1 phenylacetate--CoA ligase [bacterium]